jgi:hypothetical protein
MDSAGIWDEDMDMLSGFGKLWHEIQVNASYSHHGSYDRWMSLKSILVFPYWENRDENEVIDMLDELEQRGKIDVNLFEWQVRIAPDLAKKEMKSRAAMRKVVENWERDGGSFTYGT